jgi:hypothetical protein
MRTKSHERERGISAVQAFWKFLRLGSEQDLDPTPEWASAQE